MILANPLLRTAVCWVTAAMSWCASATEFEPNADDVLLRMFETRKNLTYTTIQSIRSLEPGAASMLMKTDADGKGRTRRTVLQPLSKQGILTLDDGRTWATVYPDSKEVLVQPSPSNAFPEPRPRIALIERNYRLSLQRGVATAGRATYVVRAAPIRPDLPVRFLTVDRETSLLLRYEVQEGSGTQVWIETKAVQYPKRPTGSFSFETLPGWKQTSCNGPDPIGSTSDLGFTPVLAPSLPFGFVVRGAHLLESNPRPLVAVRITDGLISASVYQWDLKRRPKGMGRFDGMAVTNDKGVGFVLVGDLPTSVRKAVQDAFTGP